MTTTTPIRWKELSARERDALIQTHIFNHCTHGTPSDWEHEGPEGDRELICQICQSSPRVPNFSTDLQFAFQVVEKMREKHWWSMSDNDGDVWVVYCTQKHEEPDTNSAASRSLPEAICLAALKASGVTIERE